MSDALDQPVPAVVPAVRGAAGHALGSLAGSVFVDAPLAPAFAELTLHGSSTLVRREPLTVAGEAPLWGYLASVARTSRPAIGRLEAVHVRLRVLEGRVGVGLLDVSGGAFLDAVDGVAPGDVTDVTFLIRDVREVGPLVVRNAGSGNAAFEWLGADSFQLKDVSTLVNQHVFPAEMVPMPCWSRYYGGFAATPAEGVRQFLFEQLHQPMVMRWRSDLQIVITPGEETSRALFVSGAYEPASMIALSRFLSPGGVFIDVGANVGVYTLVASRCVGAAGHVYSFEPSSRERLTLDRNVAINDCHNVTVIAAAVTDRSGTGTLRLAAGEHRGQNTLAPSFAYPDVALQGVESVDVVSLDELWQSRKLRRPDVLKIDAEGAELQVLRGAMSLLQEATPVIVFEVNDTLLQATGASRQAVQDVLTGLGYRLHRLDDSTASLLPVPTLSGVDSENFVALPGAVFSVA